MVVVALSLKLRYIHMEKHMFMAVRTMVTTLLLEKQVDGYEFPSVAPAATIKTQPKMKHVLDHTYTYGIFSLV